MTLGRELAALPDHALAPRLAALRWSDFHLNLADHVPAQLVEPQAPPGPPLRGRPVLPPPRPADPPPRPPAPARLDARPRRSRAGHQLHLADPAARPPQRHHPRPRLPVWLVDHARDNLHELLAEDDLAFLNVLRPPYIDGRVCTYYTATPADELWRLRPIP